MAQTTTVVNCAPGSRWVPNTTISVQIE